MQFIERFTRWEGMVFGFMLGVVATVVGSMAYNEIAGTLNGDGTEDWKDRDLTKTLSREPKGTVAIDYEALFQRDQEGGDDREAQDVLLMDGDLLDVPRATGLIRVAGQLFSGLGQHFRAEIQTDYPARIVLADNVPRHFRSARSQIQY